MFRNQYDNDIVTWSPQGRIHQIEYAMEAVKQGSAVVGVKSDTFAVLCSLNMLSSELSGYQKKLFQIDNHIGIGISGITADARSLCKFMRTECLNHKFVYETPLPITRLVNSVGDKSQVCTQHYGRRPYGVGLLVVGYDQLGSHLWYTCPSGNFWNYQAYSIGSRSQSARTYLEKTYTGYSGLDLNGLIKHGLTALKESIQDKKDGLSLKNCTVAFVGKNTPFAMLDDVRLQEFLDQIATGEPTTTSGPGDVPPEAPAAEPEPEQPPPEDDVVIEEGPEGQYL